ncbi:SipW-dependent-type signal peptide-containing protein [Microbacterium capsulatum]|uniref:SipW-dependent-type signal peptide-containing protein n=1 Tax=Microbacterium capsulatum TaxID=3041921 RepID=A0ABU0XGP8_9MICO|nr:SipW-dependent-type signal peptide-containing protein [Microbacterium sp. ASV81]MDQ4214299.1 SipW-dependent-type signal peptide-containing protein [Microbacterium sp. ASV81]
MNAHDAPTPRSRQALRAGRQRARGIRLRRIRAVLAGGLVLGVGAGVTLASWNDVENTTATITASRFGIRGATDGTTFAQYNPTAATLGFSAVDAAALSPGKTIYALFSVKTISGSTAGTVRLMAGTYGTGTLADYLTYGVRTVTTAQCAQASDYTSTGSAAVVPDGSALNTSATGSQTLTANGTAQVNYCFAITLPTSTPNAAQGLTLTQTWQFSATSS